MECKCQSNNCCSDESLTCTCIDCTCAKEKKEEQLAFEGQQSVEPNYIFGPNISRSRLPSLKIRTSRSK